MGRYNLLDITDVDFQVVKEYLSTGDSSVLSETRQHMLKVCRDCWGLMSKYPQRGALIHQLMAMHEGMEHKTAAKFVDFTRATWGSYVDITQDFLRTFFIDSLLKAISDPKADPKVKAKNLATLQKAIAAMPQSEIDPTLMEQNTIVIELRMGEHSLRLPQRVVRRLPKEMQEAILSGIHGDISDVEAEEILDT